MKKLWRWIIVATLGLALILTLVGCNTYQDSVRSAWSDQPTPISVVLHVGNSNTSWDNDYAVMASLTWQLQHLVDAELLDVHKRGQTLIGTMILLEPTTVGLQISKDSVEVLVFPNRSEDAGVGCADINTIRLDGGDLVLPRNYRLVMATHGAVAIIKLVKVDELTSFPIMWEGDSEKGTTWEPNNWNFTGESK